MDLICNGFVGSGCQTPKIGRRPAISGSLPALSLSALGVVFGDIGTSPLHTFKTVLTLTGAKADAAVTLGSLPPVISTLVIITAFKYVSLI